MDLISELLTDGHVLTQFDCGNGYLNQWLRTSAARGNVQDTGRTWVVHEGDRLVVGYYTLAGHALHRDSLSKSMARGLPQEIPVILLAKLAVDRSFQGQGFGRDLLLEALEHCVRANAIAASRYVVVDAVDATAAAFYRKYGFTAIPETEPTRLLRRMKDIAADLGDLDQ